MLKLKLLLVFLLFRGQSNACFARRTKIDPIHALVHRIAPAFENRFVFVQIDKDSGKDVFELESLEDKIIIRGNNFNSMAVGLNHYLKYYCHTYVSWYRTDPVRLPKTMPGIPGKIRQTAKVKNRFFLNYCTFGYTMPWWKWVDWERLIDWMSLNGINMPLSVTGEEAIWYKVWKKFGLNDQQIRSYFTGPAYLPWHRMANIDSWEGPLPVSWLNNQLKLQKQIVSRERGMNMTPVLPAFAGHVPMDIKTKFPAAKITGLGPWGGFSKKYESSFLDPLDPLFEKIQQSFLEEQSKAYGTDHIYGADPFNEVTPPSWDTAYLASVSKTIYHSMAKVDPNAAWLQMSWLFYIDRDKWTNDRIKSFVDAVPQGKLILLDYYCENTEVWKLTDYFFGQPYIWCYLGNFGGNTMLAGNLKEAENRIENAIMNGGANMSGIGSTLEGFDVNPLMYDFVFEKAWSDGPTDIERYLTNWADLRGGKGRQDIRKAWDILLHTAYTAPARLGQGMETNARPVLHGDGHWTTNPEIGYNNADLLKAWSYLIKDGMQNKNNAYFYDLVNTGRQVLGNYFDVLRKKFEISYEREDIAAMRRERLQMLMLFDDLDRLLGSQSSFLLGKWLNDARSMGNTVAEKRYFEHDARSIITIWGGGERSLDDYANRAWAGLTKDYYKKRWGAFFYVVINSVIKNEPFDQKAFDLQLNTFEDQWVLQKKKFSAYPRGNSYNISRELYKKYSPLISPDSVKTGIKKPRLTTFTIKRLNFRGLPVFALDGGMSAEYAIEKAGESLASGMSHSWKVNGRGSGPNQVFATPKFLEKSVNETVSFYDRNLGSHRRFNTVIISTGIPSVPYLARAMKAPVLPLHFLVSADSAKQIQSILSYAGAHGYAVYGTLGYDASVPHQAVAWIKLLDIPYQYVAFLIRHHVKHVVMLGATSPVGGEATAKKVVHNLPGQEKYSAGSLFLLYPQGGVTADETELNSRIKDFDQLKLQKDFTRVADWESGIIPEQMMNFSKTIRHSTAIKDVQFITGKEDIDLYKLATYVTLAFIRKNLHLFSAGGPPVKGIILNPYLISNPAFESRFGYIPLVYWQGNPPGEIIDEFQTTVKSAMSFYFPTIQFDNLNIWINSSLNFGGSERALTLKRSLLERGIVNIKTNDYSIDEVWDPADGMNAPCELKTSQLLNTASAKKFKKWNVDLAALVPSDLMEISRKFTSILITKLK